MVAGSRNAAVLVAVAFAMAASATKPVSSPARVGEEIVGHVREHFYDAKLAAAWADKHAGYGTASKDWDDFARRTSLVLAELRASHTAYFPENGLEAHQVRSIFASVLKIDPPKIEGIGAFAFEFQKHKIGPVVGKRTAGAFLAARPFTLSNGSVLWLAVEDCAVDGVRLEGVGVPVDEDVDAPIPYAAGEDPQLERALEVAAAL